MPKIPSESQEQQRLVLKLSWDHPDLEFFAVPNGGKRNPGEARILKLEGVKPGTPDLFFAEPRNEFHGLFIELKRQDKSLSTTSKAQIEQHRKLTAKGYKVEVCYGAAHAYEQILLYLDESA